MGSTVASTIQSTEKNTGLRSILQHPWAYEAFQRTVGKNRLRTRLAKEYFQVKSGQRVLDIGCGPGDLVPFIPEAEFIGYDISTDYIEDARSRFGDKATFHDGELGPVVAELAGTVDLVVMVGVLHHVDDDVARHLIKGAQDVLAPNGRFIAIEPHLYNGQHLVALVRSEQAYEDLIGETFSKIEVTRDEKLLRVPYTLSIYDCQS